MEKITDLGNGVGLKTISIDQLPERSWQYITGIPGEDAELEELYVNIPWLFRGVAIRANAVSTMPFSIYKGKREIDTSEDYQNKVGFLPNPGSLFSLVEAALTIWGYAYNFKLRSEFMTKGIRYIYPHSITDKIDGKTGKIAFVRRVNGKDTPYTTDDIIYYWMPDPQVELGRPKSSPAKSAAHAAGVLLNIDEFAAAFFKRGAIKTTILTTSNIQPAERERLKSWWQRLFGIDKAWQSEIVNAETVNPIVIGEGLESLENTELTESKRVDIAAALGIPFSVLFSNATNRATAEQDDLHLYTKTIIPECRFIEQVLNDQLFDDLGYKLTFTPENLDVFQEDENARAQSLVQLITALDQPEEFLIARDILGYEINPDTLAKIEALVAEKAKRREEMERQTQQNAPGAPQSVPQVQNDLDDTENAPGRNQTPPPPNMRAIDLDKWMRKSLKRLAGGESAAVGFDSDHIPAVTAGAIAGLLEDAQTADEVKAIFYSVEYGYP